MAVDEGRSARLSLVFKHDTGEMYVFKRVSAADALPETWMRRLNGVPLYQRTEPTKGKGDDGSRVEPRVDEKKTESINKLDEKLVV